MSDCWKLRSNQPQLIAHQERDIEIQEIELGLCMSVPSIPVPGYVDYLLFSSQTIEYLKNKARKADLI